MGYARHIGRVGALAVTLGVGAAIATAPGIAYADPSDSSTSDTSSSSSASSDASSSKRSSSTDTDTGAADNDVDESTADDTDPAEQDADEDTDEDAKNAADYDSDTTAEDDSDTSDGDDSDTSAEDDSDIPAEDDVAPPSDDTRQQRGDGTTRDGDSDHDTAPDPSSTADTADVADVAESSNEDVSSPPVTKPDEPGVTPVAETRSLTTYSIVSPPDEPTTTSAAITAPPAPAPKPTLVTLVTDLVHAMLKPFLNWGQGAPFQGPVLLAALAAVRTEMERVLFPRGTKVAAQQTVSQVVDPQDQHVLVIGVDGTNLSRILDDPANDNFFELMDTSTTAAPSIVGHTTISNPSWTAILTGAWDNKTGVINNVFTPWTYDKWPTVFNQLETLNPAIQTTAIADWNVINAIAGAGSIPADTNIFIPQEPGDTNWLDTDDAVGAATVAAIAGASGAAPNFVFSYFVGVDENGHLYGGASPQYAEAIRNVDDNLGLIMDAVAARELATGEDWTIIVVTDHGHQPQKGFGHGFQSPDETATFVMVDGPAFGDGLINTEYEIVDTTPTVLTVFGFDPRPGSDGVPLTTLGEFDEAPADLHQALRDEIAKNHSPDILTQVALGARTIFATIPYLVYTELGSVPVLGDALYVATNIPAQIVAFLTGVQGASIFPLLPPPPPSFPSQDATTVSQDCNTSDVQTCIAV